MTYPDLGIGIGLRTKHFSELLEDDIQLPIDWFEIITENFLLTQGRPKTVLDRISASFPIVPHGVSGSIGSTDPLDMDYFSQVKNLADRYEVPWVSDHLCWTGVNGKNTHDLLPMPYTEESLAHVCERVKRVQDFLQRPFILENPSSYVAFSHSTIPEWDFMRAITDRTGCGLLLDVNNIFVSSKNHSFDPLSYLAAIDPASVAQYHIAGHSQEEGYILDTHTGPVPASVWTMLEHAVRLIGPRSTLLEWDTDIPSLHEVVADARRAEVILRPVKRAKNSHPEASL